MLLDQGAQSSFSGVLAPQLLGFALDLLRSRFDLLHPLLGFALVLPRALLDLLDLALDLAHGSPVESRAQVARRMTRIS